VSVKAQARAPADLARGATASSESFGTRLRRATVRPERWGSDAVVDTGWRLRGEALVKLEAGVRSGDEVSVRHRIEIIVPSR
jgi:hypothetical protein